MNDDAYRLLVRCAHLPGNPRADHALAEMASSFQAWDDVIPLAEAHSMAPLVYTHFKQLDLSISSSAKLQLQGLYLRHKRANEIRLARLSGILTLLKAGNIPVIVLKGGVLAYRIYPAPGLRPMNDLDILVPPNKAEAVVSILREAGFTDSLFDDPTPPDHRHLPVVMQTTDEMVVSIEVHRALGGTPRFPEGESFDELWKTAVSYSFATVNADVSATAHMLGYEDMLWHLYAHMISEHTRLIRIVDIVGFAEQFMHEIDWQRIHTQYPQLIAALSVLDFVMPLSDGLRKTAVVPDGPKPDGADVMLQDWPPLPRHLWPGKTQREILQETFYPTEASLRLFYGIPVGRSLAFQRWLQHPSQIFAWYVQKRVR